LHFSRYHSPLHEAQLNLRLLKPFKIKYDYTTHEIIPLLALQNKVNLPVRYEGLLDRRVFNLIIHPGSNGSGKEWPCAHFVHLINSLPHAKYKIFITGSDKEAERFQDSLFAKCPQAICLMGQFNLASLMAFIANSDGLIAAGTGPLHISAALGIPTLGLYPPRKGINPTRWKPIGQHAQHLVNAPCVKTCPNTGECPCMDNISVAQVKDVVMRWHVAWENTKVPLKRQNL